MAWGVVASDSDPLFPTKDSQGHMDMPSLGNPASTGEDVAKPTGPLRFWKTDFVMYADGSGPFTRVIRMQFYPFSDGWNTVVVALCPAGKIRC